MILQELLENPKEYGQMYQYFLARIRNNFHLAF
jgi:hypothetical protein